MGLKVAVYAIAKNEEKFAARWAKSMAEADWTVVLDTGSGDDTVKILKENGVTVFSETVNPWRFDVARNRSLFYVPREADICVCTDLDEVMDAGWREKLEKAWTAGATRGRYRYTWRYDEQGNEDVVFTADKIHARKGYRWKFPVHEVLVSDEQENFIDLPVHIKHYPDPTKSRAQYLPLLELAVKEEPNDRNVHYLAREYMYRNRFADAIATFQSHLKLPTATWADERANSMRYTASCYKALQRPKEAERWYWRAMAEAPHMREPFLDYALLLEEEKNWAGLYFIVEKALAITERPLTYISESNAWGGLLYDLKGIAAYHLGNLTEAIDSAREAVKLSPDDMRIQGNLKFYLDQ